jgi:YHS domain-containing protein
MKKLFVLVLIFVVSGLMFGCGKKKAEEPAKEKVECAYDGMKMYKSAMEASMEYKGKTLYFCTKEEMEEFKKDPEGYLSGEKKGKMMMPME